MQLKNDTLKRFFLSSLLPSSSLSLVFPFLFRFFIQTETDVAIQVKEAAEKAMEEYKRDHPDVDELAIKVDLPETPAQEAQALALAQAQAAVAPGVIPNIYNPMAYHIYNPIPNPMVGHALVYPQVQPVFQPPPYHAAVQPAPQQHRLAQNLRARAAAVEAQQRRARQKRQAAANLKAERARLAQQVRLAEEENRPRQRLDRVRDQRAVAGREQQEREWSALEMEKWRQGERQL